MSSISPLFVVEAEQLLLAELYDDAISLCKSGLKEYPEYAAAMVVLIQCYEQKGDIKAANLELDIALKKNPNNFALNIIQKKINIEEDKTDIEVSEPTEVVNEEIISEDSEPIQENVIDIEDTVETKDIDVKEDVEEISNEEAEPTIEDDVVDEEIIEDIDDSLELVEDEVVDEEAEPTIEAVPDEEIIDDTDDSLELVEDEVIDEEAEPTIEAVPDEEIIDDIDDSLELVEDEVVDEVAEPTIEAVPDEEIIDDTDDSLELVEDEVVDEEAEPTITDATESMGEEIQISDLVPEEIEIINNNSNPGFFKTFIEFEKTGKKHATSLLNDLRIIPGLDSLIFKDKISNVKLRHVERQKEPSTILSIFDDKDGFFGSLALSEENIELDEEYYSTIKLSRENDLSILAKKIKQASSPTANQDSILNELDSANISMVSETMANIYVSQGAYQEAVNAYKELLIKNPDRKEYFLNKLDSIIPKVK